ncbi:MAG: hypothetical protein ACOCV4_09275 [Myxococcota bacterium]
MKGRNRFALTMALVAVSIAAVGRADRGAARTPAPPEAPPPLTTARIEAALARYDHEPGVDRVVAAALAAAGRDPSAMRRVARRARHSGWAPDVRLKVRRKQRQDLSLRQSDTATTRTASNDDLMIEGSLKFELDRLVFANAETRLLRESQRRRETRSELASQVVALYFERRRLQLERDLLDAHDVERAMRIAEIGALLDAFTDGAFRRMMGSPEERDR